MKKTNYFRIELCEGKTSLCDSLVSLAAMANGGGREISLTQLKMVAESETILYPNANMGTTVELIGDTILHIDRKMGDEYKTVCRIEEIEILGKVVEFETEDDLEGIFN
jgi:hypothetical protein